MRLLRIAVTPLSIALDVAAHLPGARYVRFARLPFWCKRAAHRGNMQRASRLASELLEMAKRYTNDWNYGNAIHDGHVVLGSVALAEGDVQRARDELLEAGRTPGSPQLNSFGPNMQLSKELLAVGEVAAVREYLRSCRVFWKHGLPRLDEWENDIAAGRTPQFGRNLDQDL